MTTRKKAVPQITDAEEADIQREIAANPDHPEATDAELATARPFAEAFPNIAAAFKRGRGRPKVANPLQQISIRLEPAVVAKFKASGPGWQSKINEVLKRAKVPQ